MREEDAIIRLGGEPPGLLPIMAALDPIVLDLQYSKMVHPLDTLEGMTQHLQDALQRIAPERLGHAVAQFQKCHDRNEAHVHFHFTGNTNYRISITLSDMHRYR